MTKTNEFIGGNWIIGIFDDFPEIRIKIAYTNTVNISDVFLRFAILTE